MPELKAVGAMGGCDRRHKLAALDVTSMTLTGFEAHLMSAMHRPTEPSSLTDQVNNYNGKQKV